MWTRILAVDVVYVIAALSGLDDPVLDKAGVKESHSKLMAYQDEMKASLESTPEEKESLQEGLKVLERKHYNPVLYSDDSIEEINAKSKVGQYLYQGDILLTRSQVDDILNGVHRNGNDHSKRQAYLNKLYPKTVWQNSRMAYFFDSSASERVKIAFRKAALAWRENTCIDIYEDACGLTPDRIRVSMRVGCSSFVGRIRGEQLLSLGSGCELIRHAAHELGHALGLFHARARPDRDTYVTINMENVQKSAVKEFNKKSTSHNYGVPYDVGSIMHYGSALCKPEHSADCRMGGFPHPRSCQTCISPGGYGGILCNERPAGCGQTLNAEPTFEKFSDSVGDKNHGNNPRIEFDMCYYWITAPEGKQIEVKILQFSQPDIAADGCKYGGVEIKTKPDQALLVIGSARSTMLTLLLYRTIA